jgi:hypothetical protein
MKCEVISNINRTPFFLLNFRQKVCGLYMRKYGIWYRRPRVLLRKQRMFVLDVFRGHLTLNVISVILVEHIYLVDTPGGTHSSEYLFKDHLQQLIFLWLLAEDHVQH